MPKQADVDARLADAIAEYHCDPLGYVMFCFPWDTEKSIQLVKLAPEYRTRFNSEYGPDKWACEFLDDLGEQIRERGFDGRFAVDPIRMATVSGHGIGKTTLVAWVIKFIMDTRPFAKGTVTANTDTQLRTKTWAELAKWHRMSLTERWFDLSTGRGSMSLRHRSHPETWFVAAQTSREENSESFAGQHAANSTSFYIFDEASGIPDKIYEVREGGLTDGEPMAFDFGNPTRNSGKFFEECVGRLRHRWKVRCIDSRSVAITNKKKIAQDIEDNGIESDFVKVRVLGQFPNASTAQFIPTDLVDEAMERDLFPERTAPLILGVDVARFGDDESIIYPRLGRDARSFEPKRYRGLNTVQLAGKVASMVSMFETLGRRVHKIVVDGTGVGGGVVDILRDGGFPVEEVNFGSKAIDATTYRYRGDELWGRVKDSLSKGLAIPDRTTEIGRDLKDQLTQREFGYTLLGNRIHLETKDDMKSRGIASPDVADALALTFGVDVAAVSTDNGVSLAQASPKRAIDDWDVLDLRRP